MSTIAEQLDDMLMAIVDPEDEIYKSLISDKEGTPESDPVNPVDLNIGATAGILEWNRRIAKSLLTQLFFDQSEGMFLDLIAHKYIGMPRGGGESDTEYRNRIMDVILGHKVSPASIIFYSRPYSSKEPIIYEGSQGAAYAGLSYAGVYDEMLIEHSEKPQMIGQWVFPAMAIRVEGSDCFFVLFLEDTDPADLPMLVDKLNRLIAAGVEYEIRIKYSD